ncbi:unnamed protein product [Microthlaspi erraticum]|uniref:RNase H type-1 domain-containing protein n=1 Tax=Microthlaspi erraticum TaxID=1685480 RepID=A0A6D2IQW5_9BRAS|nr:unnamed protein product [Microthlaspi erraticum]CAA7051172.1 unnamed protein product [Microthlaspi erraticum]
MEMYLWLIWYIWKVKNEKVFPNEDSDPQDLIRSPESRAIAWRLAQENDDNSRMGMREPQIQASICEVDGLWKATSRRAGLGWYSVVFETDCTDVAKMVSNPNEWSVFAILLEEIDKCMKIFTACSIHYIPRTDNKKADRLAQSARNRPTKLYYINSSPSTWITGAT